MDFVFLGFVGASESKWQTEQQKTKVKSIIRVIIKLFILKYGIDNVCIVSGKCPFGGVDIWAIKEAKNLLIPNCNIYEFKPQINSWEDVVINGKKQIGYKTRNKIIVNNSNKLYCFSPKKNDAWCYHCENFGHIKNGGCYTLKLFQKNKPLNESKLFVI